MKHEDTLGFLLNTASKQGRLIFFEMASLISDPQKNYEDFVKLLYDITDLSIKDLQNHANHYHNDGEVKLTKQVFNPLNLLSSLIVSHDPDHRGHVDALISCKQRGWELACESKIHSDYKYLNKGMNQLLERYSVAEDGQYHGALLIFIKQKDAASVVKKWMKEVPNLQESFIELQPTETRKELSFITKHQHSATGLPYYIKHIGIALYYNPVDGDNVKSQSKNESIPKIPYYTEKIAAGFPTAASGVTWVDEDGKKGINLHEKFVTNPEKSYVLQVSGLSMIDAGIPEGAYILVEQVPAKNGNIVVALINGENTLKRYVKTNTSIELHPENPDYPIIKFKETDEMSIQGVVTCVMFKPS